MKNIYVVEVEKTSLSTKIFYYFSSLQKAKNYIDKQIKLWDMERIIPFEYMTARNYGHFYGKYIDRSKKTINVWFKLTANKVNERL